MNVSALYSALETQYAAEVAANRRRLEANEEKPSATRSGDTVSLSEDGRALAAAMASGGQVEETESQNNSFERNPGGDAEEDERAREAEKAEQQASASASSGLEGRIKQIEQRIKQHGQQVTAIMNGPGTPESKISQSMPFQNEINSLQQELQELLAELKQQAQAQGAPQGDA